MLEVDRTFWLLLGVVAVAGALFWGLAALQGLRRKERERRASELAQDVRSNRPPDP